MDFNEALQHTEVMYNVRIPEDVRDDIRRQLPYYLWIVDNWEQYDDSGWPDLAAPVRKLRRLHCEACDGDRVEERIGRGWRTTWFQGQEYECPMCRAKVTAKHVSRGFKNLEDRVDVIWYQKSALDPDVIVGYAAHCTRFYSLADPTEPWTMETNISIRGAAAFEWGAGGVRIQSRPIWEHVNGYIWRISEIEWRRVKSMKGFSFGQTGCGMMYQAPPRVLLDDTLAEAIRGTPFERAWHASYTRDTDGVEALDFIARYPCCEYMLKTGLVYIVRRKLAGNLTAGLINWRGASMAKVLRLSKARLGEIRGTKTPITAGLLAVIQWADKNGVRVTVQNAAEVGRLIERRGGKMKDELAAALGLFQPSRRGKALKYIARQLRRPGGANLHFSDFADYWEAALALGGNLDSDAEAFPLELMPAHDRAIARKRVASKTGADAMIRKNAKKLEKKYGFQFGGLILRPAASAEEVIREGEALHHCVGGYVDNYAEGRTVICVLRRAIQPDEPWRTVEISAKDGHVVQDRGWHNDAGDYDLRDDQYKAMLAMFWQAWKERKTA